MALDVEPPISCQAQIKHICSFGDPSVETHATRADSGAQEMLCRGINFDIQMIDDGWGCPDFEQVAEKITSARWG